MTAEDLAQSGVDGAEARREIFPTLADGISAAPAPSDSEERLAALRRMSVMLAAAYLAAFGLAVAARGRFPEDAIFWCWSVATAVLFILGMTLWQSLMREDRIKARRIRDRDQRYRQTLALLPEGVVILGEGWRVEWVNARALEHLSLGPGCAGRSFFDSVHDEGLRRWLIERNFSGRFALEVPDGRRLEVAVVAPDARHMMIVTHDSTERMRLDDMRRDFVANVSHELRTPLTVISGFLELESAPGSVPPETLARHRELMYEQARRMKSLLDDLLLLSSLENRDEHPDEDAEVIAVPRLIEDVAREGRALSAGRHEIVVRTEDVSLIGIADEIRSAAMNLVSNAVRYTPEGGSILITWHRFGMGAELAVKDTGIGIEARHIPRLTERFYRVDKGRSRGTGGTGLGLAIVKHILRRNGGELRVESVPGKGSTFALRFSESRVFAEGK